MIHQIVIGIETELLPLKKEFRKKLMTGGAVLRMDSQIEGAALDSFVDRFIPEAAEHNLSALVLREVIRTQPLTLQVVERLKALAIPSLLREIKLRG